jgi:phosphoribosylamine-glycine ligase
MDELMKQVIANIPNFLGFVYAVVVMREQNNRLLELLARCYDEKYPKILP